MSKRHFASKRQRGRKCFVDECGGRDHHHKDQDAQAEPTGPNAQTGHCAATDTAKRQVCLRIIPVKVFSRDSSKEKITYAIRDDEP